MTNHAGGDNINDIDIRCQGTFIDEKGNRRPCNHKFFIGSPGFDIYGKPKVIEIKCPKVRCGAINVITCALEEKVIIRLKK